MRIVVFCFGRFNPPHVGHKRLAIAVRDRVMKEKRENIGAMVNGFFYLSPFDNISEKQKNPLAPKRKEFWAKKIINVSGITIKLSDVGGTAPHCATNLAKKYDKIVYVYGDDAGQIKLAQAVEKDTKAARKMYKSEILKRSGASTTITGISASAVRELVNNGNMTGFKKAYPGLSSKDSEALFKELALILYK